MSDPSETRIKKILRLHNEGKTTQEIVEEVGGVRKTIQAYISYARSITRRTLTNQQENVLKLLLEKKSNSEIMSALSISERTVKNHKTIIFEKTGFETSEGLVTAAEMAGNPSTMRPELLAARKNKLPEGIALAPRQAQVFELLKQKKTNDEMIGILGITNQAVQQQVSIVLHKLHFENREALWVAYNNVKLAPEFLTVNEPFTPAETAITYFKEKKSKEGITLQEQDLIAKILERFPESRNAASAPSRGAGRKQSPRGKNAVP